MRGISMGRGGRGGGWRSLGDEVGACREVMVAGFVSDCERCERLDRTIAMLNRRQIAS